MPLTERVIWQIERHIDKPLTLTTLADACAVSRYHMARSFRAATGMTPMTYLRARRLTVAAHALAQGADILSVALAAQYGSHEAFTRAFAACFGVLPTQVRQARSTRDLTLLEPFEMNREMIIDLQPPRFADRPAERFVGLSGDFTYDELSGVAALWQTYAGLLPDPMPRRTTYGISYDFAEETGFSYLAGARTEAGAPLPEGPDTVDVPAGHYAVFDHRGHISDIAKTFYTIFNAALGDHGLTPRPAPELEVYDHRFNPVTGRGTVEVWIPIQTPAS